MVFYLQLADYRRKSLHLSKIVCNFEVPKPAASSSYPLLSTPESCQSSVEDDAIYAGNSSIVIKLLPNCDRRATRGFVIHSTKFHSLLRESVVSTVHKPIIAVQAFTTRKNVTDL